MRAQASAALPIRASRRSKARRSAAPVARTGDLVAVVLFALAGLCLSIGAPLLSPETLGIDEQSTVIGE